MADILTSYKEMKLKDIQAVYFVGAGGIGMSALARYFHHKGLVVAGYDKTPSDLTHHLEQEGIQLHYEDNINLIPETCKDPSTTLVVYTPAVPNTHTELTYFRENGFEIEKRSQVLGRLTQTHKGLCFAGTHGKTTTSTMCAHIMHESHLDCNAFLGGISKNYGTNYIFSQKSDYVVIEADEFDRSFHWLRPYMSVITSTDPDHLDIYGTKDAYLESFRHYTELIQPGGTLVIHKDLEMKQNVQTGVKVYEYSRDAGNFHAENVRIQNGTIVFDMVSPIENVTNIELGQPVPINIENGGQCLLSRCDLSRADPMEEHEIGENQLHSAQGGGRIAEGFAGLRRQSRHVHRERGAGSTVEQSATRNGLDPPQRIADATGSPHNGRQHRIQNAGRRCLRGGTLGQ